MLIQVLFAFLAGVVTVLSPCILPLLPILLSGTVGGGKAKPWGVVTGFVISFSALTLFLSEIVKLTRLPADIFRFLAIGILIVSGIFLLVPALSILTEKLANAVARIAPKNSKPGFSGGFLLGLTLGALWTPCVGPILASVMALALSGSVNGTAVLITLAYAVGTAIPMMGILLGGRKLTARISRPDRIQKIFGTVMIGMGLLLIFNLDRQFSVWVLTKIPDYSQKLTKLETLAPTANSGTAPELVAGGQWFNLPAGRQVLTMKELRGKVVLVDFWTYTCINCIRTFPYLKAWDEKYRDKGLVIIGVHTPEFEFEKDPDNVKKAIADFGIKYPVMQDNNYATWNAYNNQYWPAEYLIDQQGVIKHTSFGEGEYDQTEGAIQSLLSVSMPINNPTYDINAQTPELYLGNKRYETGYVKFEGNWDRQEEYAAPSPGADLTLDYQAQNAYIVLGPTGTPATVQVYLDNVLTQTITVDTDKLYTVAALKQPGAHHLKLVFPDGNIRAFSFTFG